jgi:cytosine/uracil/thiamine/allantoin permease
MAPSWLRWAELPARTDIHQDKGTTKWGNYDLYPIVEKERTYRIGAYLLFWVTCGGGLSTFAIRSSYIVLGLTAGQTCGAVLIGATLSSLNTLALGKVGAVNHMGFVSVSTLGHLEAKLTFIDYVGTCLLRIPRVVSPSNPRLHEQHSLLRLASILRRLVNQSTKS